MSLTITEKQHWKDRIDVRISAEIRKLKASDPAFFQLISDKARKSAVDKLGITDAHAKMEELGAKIQSLKDELEKIEVETARKFKTGHLYYPASIVDTAINELVPAEEERLMQEHPLGKRVIELGNEKESLLDTVWLATSSPQIRDLWQQVDVLLSTNATALQTELFHKKKPS